jgi:hypothetical protein
VTIHSGTAPSDARHAGTPSETESADLPPATEDQPTGAASDARAAKYARRVAEHADQERLARRFINVAHERLAGRDPASRRLLGRQPRERVVLGVLAPQVPPTADPPVTVQDLPAEPGVPVDQLPASELGLTCLVAPATDSLTIEATVRFALYLQHYPTYDEQLRHAALTAGHDDPAADAQAPPEAHEEAPPEPESQAPKPGSHAAGLVPSRPQALLPAREAARPATRRCWCSSAMTSQLRSA